MAKYELPIYGENDETPASYSTAQRTYQQAFAVLGLKGKYNNHDWRAFHRVHLYPL